MNRYGRAAREYWTAHLPQRTSTLPDLTTFFSELGDLVQATVSDLTSTLAGPDPMGEAYADKARRLAAARSTAEEIAMRQLVWIDDPDLPLDQARQEWDETSPNHDNLARWAVRMQDAPEQMPTTDELESMASEWAVPTEFLHQLVAAESPWALLRSSTGLLQEAATTRFLRTIR